MKGGMLQVFRREWKEGERGDECSLWTSEVLYVLSSKVDVPPFYWWENVKTITYRVCINLSLWKTL